MKKVLWLVLTVVLANSVWAETRNLTSDWQFANKKQFAEYQVDWPLQPNNDGAAFTIRNADGSLFLQASVKDIKKKDLFASDNMVGKYRYYHPNGKLKKEGQWGSNGRRVGLETVYGENGFPLQVDRYSTDGWYVTEKNYYDNGQLSYEGLDFDGNEFKESKFYYSDGKLKERWYKKTQDGVVKEINDHYDKAGRIERYTEKYGDDPILEITYSAAGKLLNKKSIMLAEERNEEEIYDLQGKLIDLAQYTTIDGRFERDGQQIQSYDGKIAYSMYKNGVQQDEVKTVKDGKVISYGHYKDGKSIGDWFYLNESSENSISFHQYDSNENIVGSYKVGLDYIHYDDQGMPVVTLPTKAETRLLPELGTVWAYNSGGKKNTQLKLISVEDAIVNYQFGNHTIQENLNDYTPVSKSEPNRKILSFPLTLGKEWKGSYQKQIKVPWGDESEWEYTYQAKSSSYITGVEKITVAGGTFDTLVIERSIHWTKSKPHHNGKPMTEMVCDTKSCQVSGYTKEVLWYAPSAGRGVLKAVAIAAYPLIMPTNSQEMLQSGNSLISELIYFGPQPAENQAMPTPKYAHEISGSAFSQGFPLMMNNTWEFMMIHSPLIE